MTTQTSGDAQWLGLPEGTKAQPTPADVFIEGLVSDMLSEAGEYIDEPAGRGCGYGLMDEGYAAAERVLRTAISRGTIVVKV